MVEGEFGPTIARLRRAHGHLATLLTMMAEGRSCLELAQQLHAIERAIASSKREFIHSRIDRCLTIAAATPLQAKSALSEIRSLGKYL
jgi:DNA-binding FrmR family transcriptional regulator